MMVQRWRISDVVEGPESWLIFYEPLDDGGEAFAASWPKEAFEIRMAEHGLETVDEAIEVLLYTPLLHAMHADGQEDALPVLEGDATSARARVLGQVAACKERFGEVATSRSAVRRGQADPLQVLRDGVRTDPVRIAAMRLDIDRYLLASERADKE
ncbi:hypothetical protein [Nonomuraea sp. NPDC049758]|uniref:hypothetical protein n=1 Tax=Nonomuraea sp. NPDC049758 TaxID=3154360 RepID=UPI003414E8AE